MSRVNESLKLPPLPLKEKRELILAKGEKNFGSFKIFLKAMKSGDRRFRLHDNGRNYFGGRVAFLDAIREKMFSRELEVAAILIDRDIPDVPVSHLDKIANLIQCPVRLRIATAVAATMVRYGHKEEAIDKLLSSSN